MFNIALIKFDVGEAELNGMEFLMGFGHGELLFGHGDTYRMTASSHQLGQDLVSSLNRDQHQ